MLRSPARRCAHNLLPSQCEECRVTCPHGAARDCCRECKEHLVCEHNKWRHHCVYCNPRPQYKRCPHGKKRSVCRVCSAHLVCEHDHFRSKCRHCKRTREEGLDVGLLLLLDDISQTGEEGAGCG